MPKLLDALDNTWIINISILTLMPKLLDRSLSTWRNNFIKLFNQVTRRFKPNDLVNHFEYTNYDSPFVAAASRAALP